MQQNYVVLTDQERQTCGSTSDEMFARLLSPPLTSQSAQSNPKLRRIIADSSGEIDVLTDASDDGRAFFNGLREARNLHPRCRSRPARLRYRLRASPGR